jgi:hypothetical protein
MLQTYWHSVMRHVLNLTALMLCSVGPTCMVPADLDLCACMWLYPTVQIMSNSGTALLGIGRGAGPDRAEEAIYDAINTPLLQGHAIQVGAHNCLLDGLTLWCLLGAPHVRHSCWHCHVHLCELVTEPLPVYYSGRFRCDLESSSRQSACM